MNPRLKASLLWGVTGALAFLVLVQAFRLVTGEGVTLLVMLGVAGFVAAGASVSTYVLEGRLGGQKEQS